MTPDEEDLAFETKVNKPHEFAVDQRALWDAAMKYMRLARAHHRFLKNLYEHGGLSSEDVERELKRWK